MKKLQEAFPTPLEIPQNISKISLEGMVDTHIHTSPDIKPRIFSDDDAVRDAKNQHMASIILKCHVESTAGRSHLLRKATGFDVFGGICLNSSVGGINPDAVEVSAALNGKIVWMPTISVFELKKDVLNGINGQNDNFEKILHLISKHDMILATGHLKAQEIFPILDMAHSLKIKKIIVNHPLTGVVDATLEEQKEMSRYAYLEHCFVACMPQHDQLSVERISEAINFTGFKKCIMATDFGQKHNPIPSEGFKMFIYQMKECGFSNKQIETMCSLNPRKLIY
ncbi:DUF6282 family protein [Methanobacterium alcaliphilum]|uniref:DUF6282 family protein n=1 Tax=Methanobacterium alcaliphilum TaxID=392018 RepID=UPI00200AA946|nr:DUF6282 family protein [Methanobacterium alcaliphilum]MCK9151301.1 DUF6282 family protein [Methanobacterium alcaliphilum]